MKDDHFPSDELFSGAQGSDLATVLVCPAKDHAAAGVAPDDLVGAIGGMVGGDNDLQQV